MLRKNESLLLIDFQVNRGLLLKWQVPRNLNTTFFRHILIFDINQGFDVKSFSSKYFHRMKLGDIITFACITEQVDFHILKWREKSLMTQIQVSMLKPSTSNIKDIALMLQEIDKITQDFTEPIIYNFITQKKSQDIFQLQNTIKNWMGNKQKFISNIFASLDTSINPMTGINFFNLEEFQGEESECNWQFYKLYLTQISLLKIKITLECENGFFASKKEDEWKNIDFNKITRVISGPSINYLQDTIRFLNEDSSPEVNYVLKILLEFTELDNRKYSASKKLTIKAMNQKLYHRTFTGREIEQSIEVFPGFYSRKNPFKSDSLVWFKKQVCEKGNKIEANKFKQIKQHVFILEEAQLIQYQQYL